MTKMKAVELNILRGDEFITDNSYEPYIRGGVKFLEEIRNIS